MFSEADAVNVITQILQATEACHAKGIAHRDLKPENILIDPENNGLIKIIDFGTAQSQFDVEEISADMVFGTPYYNAPEVLICEFSEKSDMWSIGVILYLMLSGIPPFAGANDNKIMNLIQNGQIDYDPTYWRDKSEDVQDFIKALIVKDPDQRLTAKQALKHPWITKANTQ